MTSTIQATYKRPKQQDSLLYRDIPNVVSFPVSKMISKSGAKPAGMLWGIYLSLWGDWVRGTTGPLKLT